MAMFDTLVDDLASRYGLGANARTFVREVLAMIANSPGGVGGFLDTAQIRRADLGGRLLARPPRRGSARRRARPASAWLYRLGGVANRLGLSQGVVATAMGYALPKIVGLLTPGGAIPVGVPAEVTRFLSPAPAAAVTPRRVDAPPSRTPEQRGIARWLWPALGALVVVGFLSYFWSTLNRIPSAPPVATAPEPATPAPSTVAQAPSPPPAPSPVAQAPTPPPQPAAQAPAPASTGTPAASSPSPPPAPLTDAQATAPQVSPQPRQAPAPASTATQATPPPPPAPAASTQAQATAPQAPPAPTAQAPAAPASPPTTEQAPAPPAPPTTTAQAPSTPAPAAVATAEPTAPASAATPTRLALSNDNGVERASGVVRDQDAKATILDALNAVFGADKVKSDISVDQSAAASVVAWRLPGRP